MSMFHSELISRTVLNDKFHTFCEQLGGENPASIVQKGRRPKSELAYTLAYFKAFAEPESDTSEVQALLGMLHFGMLCAGPEYDIVEVTGFPHGLRCLQNHPSRRGVLGIIITGDGDQWATAIRNAGYGSPSVQMWGQSCHQEFTRHNLDALFGRLKPNRPGGTDGYLLE